jgi:Zn-dependent protease
MSLLGGNWWVNELYQSGGWAPVLSWIFWIIASITLHELAHGVVAIWNGDNTPRELGHMTANPVVHMGVPSLLVFAVAGIAWGQMPTDPYYYRNRRFGNFTVAIAGPVTNLLLAFFCLSAAAVWAWLVATHRVLPEENLDANLTRFLWWGGVLNLILAVFNMLPIPPLDGSRVLGAINRDVERFYDIPEVRLYGMIAVLILFCSVVLTPLQVKLMEFSANYVQTVAVKLVETAPGDRQIIEPLDETLPPEAEAQP